MGTFLNDGNQPIIDWRWHEKRNNVNGTKFFFFFKHNCLGPEMCHAISGGLINLRLLTFSLPFHANYSNLLSFSFHLSLKFHLSHSFRAYPPISVLFISSPFYSIQFRLIQTNKITTVDAHEKFRLIETWRHFIKY